jgi:hypothetical protein
MVRRQKRCIKMEIKPSFSIIQILILPTKCCIFKMQGCSLHLVKHVGKGITKFRPSAPLRTTETSKNLQAHSLCPLHLRLDQCAVGIWFFVIPALVLGSWKFSESKNCQFQVSENFQNQRTMGFGYMKKNWIQRISSYGYFKKFKEPLSFMKESKKTRWF